MQVGQYVTVNGEVVSHLNISGVLTNDGGQYACIASSTVGSVKHAARLNVYGLPYIRWGSLVYWERLTGWEFWKELVIIEFVYLNM